ncbi:MAG TPA: hypothetical protein VFK41_02105 [Nocardioidaceae bacterium]|nr:hypothetical protein [Nocardioidaceae bacterium]
MGRAGLRRYPLLVAAMVAAGFAPYPEPAVASCAPPMLQVDEGATLERGTTATVEGRGFVDGCQDSMSCSSTFGCDDCEWDDPETPREDVALRLVQGKRTWELGVVDAGTAEEDQKGWVTWTFEVPPDAHAGRARLEADLSPAVRVVLN